MEEKIKEKICSACHELKPLTEFHRSKAKKFGRNNICKKCASKYAKQYHLTNRESEQKRHKEYYHNHKEQKCVYNKIYNKKYRLNHKKELNAKRRQYRECHKRDRREESRKYRQSEKGKFIRTIGHRRRCAKMAASVSDLTSEQWARILKNQKYRCNICHKKFAVKRPATMDHIIPLSKGGDFTSSNVQALCLSCNSSKNAKVLKGFINSWCL